MAHVRPLILLLGSGLLSLCLMALSACSSARSEHSPSMPSNSTAADRDTGFALKKNGRSAANGGSGGLPTQEFEATPAEATGPRGALSLAQLEDQAVDRYQMKEATVVVEVLDVADATDQTLADIARYGGYVLTSEEKLGPDRTRTATLTCRVPSKDFEAMLRSLAALGTVLTRNTTSEDVTEEYVDLESDLASKKVIEERVASYLAKSDNLEEMRRLQAELDAIRADILRFQGRLNFLATRTSFSTINITIQTAAVAASPVPLESYSIEKVYNDALRSQVGWMRVEFERAVRMTVWLLFRLPVILLWGALIWFAWRLMHPKVPAMKAALNRSV